eukprot:CAMPEP_0195521384 /NCGR_PEP_ID=MMETSP0794_2-20130614/18581_1 /TAXON_ID=515487 /ORGANISM="Stephanopyxis turris, Strain CCMP 815" /LENGTH=539 /DNA_ID=CAMNT_0040650925 /DNA_START=79 /DNA_END=1698 /DNA_ORIENTATION=-
MTGRFLASALLLLLLRNSEASSTTLIDASGTLQKPALNSISNGIVTVINPTSSFSSLLGDDQKGEVVAHLQDNGVTLISTPGANSMQQSTKLLNGWGCAAASSPAGVIVLDGLETTDLELGWRDSRIGRSLECIFGAAVDQMNGGEKRVILVGVNAGVDVSESLKSQQEFLRGAEMIWGEVMATGGDEGEGVALEDVFEVRLVSIQSASDVQEVMASAMAEAPSRSSSSSILGESYTKGSPTLNSVITFPHEMVESLLICDDAHARHSRTIRAKLSSWKHRISRNFCIDKFGAQATSLYNSILQNYDQETVSVSGGHAAEYRLSQRAKLQTKLQNGIESLFTKQIAICETNAVKRLQRTLLNQRKKGDSTKANAAAAQDANAAASAIYDDNAAAVRSAAFAFDTSASDLEVPPLNLLKTSYSANLSAKLHDALNKFDDSPAAKLQDLMRVSKTANREAKIKKQQQGNEPSLEVGLGLTAMFRPDGYGNLQGFAGYSMGPHTLTVGCQNDADSPETISQFGGVRPPFLRVQPKLNLDVEL